jgi:hypothetical protein
MIELANGIRAGEINLWQAVLDRAAKRGATPGPMAAMMAREFEDEVPF